MSACVTLHGCTPFEITGAFTIMQKNSNAFRTVNKIMDIENIQSKLFIGIWKSENKDMTVVPITTENSCTLWCNQVPSLRNAIWEKPAHINIARNNRILFQHSDSNRPVTSNRSFRSPTDLTQLRLAWNKNCSVFYCAVKLQNSFCDALYNFSSHKQTTIYIYF